MRVMPNRTVLSPCDATQTKLAVIAAAAEMEGPVYLRFGREAVPDFTSDKLEFRIGKAQTMHKGHDLTVISTGHMTWEALQAAYELEKKGIGARVINMHTIKPIDKEIIIKAATETGTILTVEEHQITGGLGAAVAEVIVKNSPVPMDFIGVNDRFGESGQPDELMEKYGLKSINIIEAAIKLLEKKNS